MTNRFVKEMARSLFEPIVTHHRASVGDIRELGFLGAAQAALLVCGLFFGVLVAFTFGGMVREATILGDVLWLFSATLITVWVVFICFIMAQFLATFFYFMKALQSRK